MKGGQEALSEQVYATSGVDNARSSTKGDILPPPAHEINTAARAWMMIMRREDAFFFSFYSSSVVDCVSSERLGKMLGVVLKLVVGVGIVL